MTILELVRQYPDKVPPFRLVTGGPRGGYSVYTIARYKEGQRRVMIARLLNRPPKRKPWLKGIRLVTKKVRLSTEVEIVENYKLHLKS